MSRPNSTKEEVEVLDFQVMAAEVSVTLLISMAEIVGRAAPGAVTNENPAPELSLVARLPEGSRDLTLKKYSVVGSRPTNITE